MSTESNYPDLPLPPDSSASDSSREASSDVNSTAAFDRLYRKHAAAVLRFATRCVGRREVAEELTAEAFLRLHKNLRQIDQDALPAWLYTVVRNLAVSYWRHCQLEEKYFDRLPIPPQMEAPPVLTSLLGIEELKPAHRACLILRYVQDMDRSEIAARLGLTENQVKSCLQYGLELLRKHLAREKSGS